MRQRTWTTVGVIVAMTGTLLLWGGTASAQEMVQNKNGKWITLKQACNQWEDALDEPTRNAIRTKCFKLDVVVGNQGDLPELGQGQFNQLLTNKGDGTLTFTATNLPAGPKGITLVDPVAGVVAYVAGKPTTAAAVALADVNTAGHLSIFIANHGYIDSDDDTMRAGESNVLLKSRPNGIREAKVLDVTPLQIRNNTHVAAGDLDNDGDIDFIVTSDGNPVRVYINNDSDGHFTARDVTPKFVGEDHNGNPVVYAEIGPVSGGPRRSLHVALGDLNGDGHLDAIIVNDGDPAQVLINRGNSTFDISEIEPLQVDDGTGNLVPIVDGEGVAIADLDGDGDLDAIIVYDGDGALVAWNDGSGNFTLETVPDAEGFHSKDVAIGDFDGDGDFDAIVVNTTLADEITPEKALLLRNNGDGTFDVTEVGRETRGEVVVAADFDGDGDLDVLIGNTTKPSDIAGGFGSHPNYILRNDGLDLNDQIIFTAVTVPGGAKVTDGLAVGDINQYGAAKVTDDLLPNINPDGLLPGRYPGN